MIGDAYLVLLAAFVLVAAAHAVAACLRGAGEKADRLISGETRFVLRRLPARRLPAAPPAPVHRVLDDMPHH